MSLTQLSIGLRNCERKRTCTSKLYYIIYTLPSCHVVTCRERSSAKYRRYSRQVEGSIYYYIHEVVTTSMAVAEKFGKRHADVIRSIQTLECSEEFTQRNFALSEYKDSTGRTLKAYNITRDGFMFLAMGFTGKPAMQWKEKFIQAFN